MKKFIIALTALLLMTASVRAMSYEQARNQALFLTDKMAYELNLTEDQYEAAYEINLDYLMGVNSVDDLYGIYWQQRNLDLSYILLDWQYRNFCAASYFYRPIYWDGGYWHFGIYARYPHRDYFYFGCPNFYVVYRGGHSWRMNGGHSWYRDRYDWGRPAPGGRSYGMRDGWQRGDYRNGFNNNQRTSFGNGGLTRSRGAFNSSAQNATSFGAASRSNIQSQVPRTFNRGSIGRESSTRTTVTRGNNRNTATFGGSRSVTIPGNQFNGTQRFDNRTYSAPNSTFTAPNRNTFSAPSRSFSAPSSSFGSPSSGNRGGFGGGSSSGSHSFGGHR